MTFLGYFTDPDSHEYHILYWVFFVLSLSLAAVVVPGLIREKRTPEGTAAWLMLIWLLPFVGYLAYLFFAGRKVRRKARKKARLGFTRDAHMPETRHPLDHLLRSFGLAPALRGHRLAVHPTGEAAYKAIIALIEGARESIWVASYILEDDEVSEAIMQALGRRAREGLDVRLILDDAGTTRRALRRCRSLLDGGGRISRFMPIMRITRWNRLNFRNHRKMVLTDQTSVLLGGMNIGSSYFGPGMKEGRWRDLAVTISGPAATVAAAIFAADWQFTEDEALALKPPSPPLTGIDAAVQIIPSGPDVEDDPFHAALIGAIHGAKRRIWLATPYFVPNDALLDSLTVAARRGIEVRLIVPNESDHWIVDLAAAGYLREMEKAGAAVLRYMGGMMHGKVGLIDHDIAVVGSANLDARSLFLNYEIVAFLYGHPECAALDAWIEELSANAERGMPKVGQGRETVEGLVRLLSPIL